MNLNNLKIGDLIIRDKGPLSAHYIVYVGVHDSQHIVAENQNGHGVRYTTLREALFGYSIRRFEPFGGTEAERNLVIPKINQLLGTAYDLVVFNCEHFARWIASGKVESKQVKAASTVAIGGGAGLLIAGIAKSNPLLATLGIVSILLGGAGHTSQRK